MASFYEHDNGLSSSIKAVTIYTS